MSEVKKREALRHAYDAMKELAGHVRTVIARPEGNDDNGDCDSDDTVVVDPE